MILAGCGNMGKALLKAWLKTESIQKIHVIEPSLSSKSLFAKNSKIAFYSHARELPLDLKPTCLVLAFKPQQLSEAIGQFKLFFPDTLVISLLSGTSIQKLQKHTGDKTQCVRIMPNIGVQMSEGATLAFPANTQKQAYIEALFNHTGKLFWVPSEKSLDDLTPISGCGPAYFYLMAEILTKITCQLGLEKVAATALVQQTLLGSALMTSSDTNFKNLISTVTSKGGVTEAALSILEPELNKSLKQAIQAALIRITELEK